MTDFAIEVSGFPETVIDENEIYSFFTQFGQVIEARLARNYFGTLLNYTKQAKLEVKCAIEKRKNQLNGGKSAKKIARIEQKIEKLKKSSARKLEKKFQDVPKVILLYLLKNKYNLYYNSMKIIHLLKLLLFLKVLQLETRF